MRYELALSPDLKVGTTSFVQEWQQRDGCQAITTARVAQGNDEVYDAASLEGGIVLLESVGEDVSRHELYEAIEGVLRARGVEGALTQTPIEQPDGSVFLTISYAADRDDR